MCDRKSLVEVVMIDGAKCRMAPKALNLFLAVNRVFKFKRANGWATVGVDPLRKTPPQNIPYSGTERRAMLFPAYGETAILPC